MSDQPDNLAGTGRDASGRFLPGHRGIGGRPRGIDLRRVVHERAASEGIDLEDALWRVVKTLTQAGEQGDVAAAKLVFDRLCDAEPTKIEAVHIVEAAGPTPPPIVDLITGAARLADLARGALGTDDAGSS